MGKGLQGDESGPDCRQSNAQQSMEVQDTTEGLSINCKLHRRIQIENTELHERLPGNITWSLNPRHCLIIIAV